MLHNDSGNQLECIWPTDPEYHTASQTVGLVMCMYALLHHIHIYVGVYVRTEADVAV